MRTTVLDNGLTIVTERMPDVRSVTAGFWVNVGSRDEQPGEAGTCHVLEHLLFKGTERWSAQAIAEAVDACGGEMNAFTAKEHTAFYVRTLADDLPVVLDVLCGILTEPALRPVDVDAELQVILDEMLMHADEPGDIVHDLVAEGLFPDHPLGRRVLGDEDVVEALDAPTLRAFFDAHYRPPAMVFAAAGLLDHDELVAAVAERFEGRGGRPATPARSAPGELVTPVIGEKRPTEQAHLVVALRAVDHRSDDRYPLEVLAEVLGGGLSSRLFQEIREQRGLVYGISAHRVGYQDAGALLVSTGTAPEHVDEVLGLIHRELDGIVADGVTERELTVAKSGLRGALLLGLEDSGARWSRIGRSQIVHGRVVPVDEVLGRIDAVTLDDVARVGQAHLRGERVLAAVGPRDPAGSRERG